MPQKLLSRALTKAVSGLATGTGLQRKTQPQCRSTTALCSALSVQSEQLAHRTEFKEQLEVVMDGSHFVLGTMLTG